MKKTLLTPLLLLLPLLSFAEVNQQLIDYIEAVAHGQEFHTEGHCGFRYQFEIRQHLDELSAEHKAMFAKISERPARQVSYISPGGHFIFYYDTSGTHQISTIDEEGNGVPDYIDSAAVIFDRVWDVEIDQLGFQPPLDAGGNPVELYPIYFTILPSNLYGQTWLEAPIRSVPDAWTSYIEINTDLEAPSLYTQGLDGLRVTAAHEFNHAIQLGYRVWEDEYDTIIDLFLMEMTSTWMEDYVYDEINDYYQYLDQLFRLVGSIRFTSIYNVFPYGNSIYLHMLEQLFGPEIVVQIWQRIRTEPGMEALDYVLRRYASSWPVTQNLYARWLYFTGERYVPGRFFPEAAFYPMLSIKPEEHFILNENLDLELEISAQTVRHFVLENASDIRYKVRMEGASPEGYYSHMSKLNLDSRPSGVNLSQAFYPGDTDSIILAVSNPLDSTIVLQYSIQQDTVLFTGVGPNLITVTTDEDMAHFYNVPAQATIRIFTMNGRFVKALKTGVRSESRLSFPLRDRFDQNLATGIYIYTIDAPGLEKMGKIAVVRR